MDNPFKILLDAGHGDHDFGASYHNLHEKDINLQICLKTFKKLQFKYWCAMTRLTDTFISINDRWKTANYWNADLLLSLHCNADPDEDLPDMPEAQGEEIWICKGSKQSRIAAECMIESVDNFFPDHKFRGIKETSHIGVLRWSIMPAVLIEIGFIDNKETNTQLSEDYIINRIADLLNSGVKKYYRKLKRV